MSDRATVESAARYIRPPMVIRVTMFHAPTAIALLLVACAPVEQGMRPQYVEQFGQRTYDAPRERVLAAAEGAMRAVSWGVESVEPSSGVLRSNRIVLPRHRSSYGTERAIVYRYEVHVEPAGDDHSRVRIVPRAFTSGREITDLYEWTLEGPSSEKARWAALFRETEVALSAPARNPARADEE